MVEQTNYAPRERYSVLKCKCMKSTFYVVWDRALARAAGERAWTTLGKAKKDADKMNLASEGDWPKPVLPRTLAILRINTRSRYVNGVEQDWAIRERVFREQTEQGKSRREAWDASDAAVAA